MTSQTVPEPKRDETLRTVIVSRISNTGTLAISVLTLLVILLTLVEQRLHQFRTEIDEAARVRARTARRMQVALESLKPIRRQFHRYIHTPKTGKKRPLAEVSPLLDLTAADYANFHRVFRPRFLMLKPEEQRTAFGAAQTSLQDLLAQDKKNATPAEGSKEATRLSPWRRQDIELGLETLEEYRNRVEMIMEQRASVATHAERIRAVQAKTESIPTPFGSFQINAHLALLGLAFAALLSYLYFASACRAIVRLGAALVANRDPEAIDAIAIPAPLWLYAAEPRVRALLSWQEDDEPAHRIATSVLHLTWIGIGVVAAIEAWRDSAARMLVFDRHGLSYLLLAILVLVAVLLFASAFSGAGSDASNALAASLVTRRTVLRLLGTALVVGAVLFLARHRRKPRRLRKHMRAREIVANDGIFVVNAKTGVAHYPGVCSHHLPKKRRTEGPTSSVPVMHRRWEAAVLYGMVRDIEDSLRSPQSAAVAFLIVPREMAVRDFFDAEAKRLAQEREAKTRVMIPLLEKAIQYEPWSFHLHHKLMQLYGRERRYGDIRDMIEKAKAAAEAALAKQPRSRAIQKAKEEFERLLTKVKDRERVTRAQAGNGEWRGSMIHA